MHRHSRRPFSAGQLRLEYLEDRTTPTTYTVGSLADAGAQTLRADITQANLDSSADTIVIPSTLSGTIDLSTIGDTSIGPTALPLITNTITIQGSGQTITLGTGAPAMRLFAVGPVTKGTFWEMTAVPDIRRQTEKVAEYLAGLIKAPPPDKPGAGVGPFLAAHI